MRVPGTTQIVPTQPAWDVAHEAAWILGIPRIFRQTSARFGTWTDEPSNTPARCCRTIHRRDICAKPRSLYPALQPIAADSHRDRRRVCRCENHRLLPGFRALWRGPRQECRPAAATGLQRVASRDLLPT